MKAMIRNPFITSGYVSADYFCDRQQESEQLVREVMNGNNLALVSTRRMGKTGLIRHCFQFPEIKQDYYTFFIDIYDSRSLRDLVFALSKEILEVLKPIGKKALHGFWECVKSLQASISFDVNGMPSLNLGLGDIQAPATTLDEIFRVNLCEFRCQAVILALHIVVCLRSNGKLFLLALQAHGLRREAREHQQGDQAKADRKNPERPDPDPFFVHACLPLITKCIVCLKFVSFFHSPA